MIDRKKFETYLAQPSPENTSPPYLSATQSFNNTLPPPSILLKGGGGGGAETVEGVGQCGGGCRQDC